jgi:hypothetical protein
MYIVSLTELTSHFEMLELKLEAPWNMLLMSVTELTFHLEMSELKLDAPHVCDMLHTPGSNLSILITSGTGGICCTALTDVIVNSSL